MNRATWFNSKWHWLKRFGLAAALGAVLIAVGFIAEIRALRVIGRY